MGETKDDPSEAQYVLAVRSPPNSLRRQRAAVVATAEVLGLSMAEARALVAQSPSVFPKSLDRGEAERVAERLRATGAVVEARLGSSDPHPCKTHPALTASGKCQECEAPLCTVCRAVASAPLCHDCAERRGLRRKLFRIRVALLLSILLGVCLWAWRDARSRRERSAWDHTLRVAVILLRTGPVDDRAIVTLRERASFLEERLQAEIHRYRPDAPRPVVIDLFGPVDRPPELPKLEGDGLVDLAEFNLSLQRKSHLIDDELHVDGDLFDSEIYVALRPPASAEHEMVEGASQAGGRIGTVSVELDETMADFALFVVAHELFHTLGATDKYDGSGRTLFPGGFVEPERHPLFPQRFAEVMARNRPISRDEEVVPAQLDELAVGAETAREIGWAH